MTAFTYKGYGRIYTNPENIQDVENIIKELSEFEWGYYPGGLVVSWDRYPNVEYVGKFELNENKFKELCKERNIPVFIFDNGTEYETYGGYQKTLNREEIKTLSYEEHKMTIKITDLLDLLAYAGQLDLSIFVREDEDGYYVLKFYELYTNDFDGSVVITEEGESDWNKGTHSFDSMMDTFVDMLSNKKEEKLKAQKRQELLNRLTDEELELLGVVK